MAESIKVMQQVGAEAASPPLIEVYLARRANLVRFFAARLRSVAAAEDLVQELYFKLLALDASADVHNPSALLYRIGSNLLQDRLRGERRARDRDQAWRESEYVSIGGVDVLDAPSAEDVVASRERLEQLAAAVAGMPQQMQRAFRLHKLQGLSHAETARIMGISTSAVEKHISAALKALLKGLR